MASIFDVNGPYGRLLELAKYHLDTSDMYIKRAIWEENWIKRLNFRLKAIKHSRAAMKIAKFLPD